MSSISAKRRLHKTDENNGFYGICRVSWTVANARQRCLLGCLRQAMALRS